MDLKYVLELENTIFTDVLDIEGERENQVTHNMLRGNWVFYGHQLKRHLLIILVHGELNLCCTNKRNSNALKELNPIGRGRIDTNTCT